MQRLVAHIHGQHVHTRRVRTLIQHLRDIVPANARVLDVGSGDGLLAAGLKQLRPDLEVEGIDVLVRPDAHIPITYFDGITIPFAAGSFDVVLFVDVLHHTDDPMILLREAVRVTRRSIILKDHTRDGLLAGPTLRFMDWVGNSRHGVSLPYNYWSERQWLTAFAALNLQQAEWHQALHLYPPPMDWVFGRGLHFIARFEVESKG